MISYIIVFEAAPQPALAIWADDTGNSGILDGPGVTPEARDLWVSRLAATENALEFVHNWGEDTGMSPVVESMRRAESLREINAVLMSYNEMSWSSPLFYDPYSGGPIAVDYEAATAALETPGPWYENTTGHGPGDWSAALRESVWSGLSASGIQLAAFQMFGKGIPAPERAAPDAAMIVMEALYAVVQDALPKVPAITMWRGMIGGPAPSRDMPLLPASSWSLSEDRAQRVAERSRTRGFVVEISLPPERIIAIEPLTRTDEVLISGGRVRLASVRAVDGGGDLIRDPESSPEMGTADWMRHV